MKTSRNIGGSLLPSNDSRILSPVPFRNGSLQVRPDAEHDTHALWFVAAGQETKLAQHPNGYSCRSLAERILSGDSVRVMDQADYIVACGGTADAEAIKALADMPTPSQSKPADEVGQTVRPRRFITLIDLDGRKSSLAYGGREQVGRFLEVVGVLPHGSDIKPATEEDRLALVEFLAPGYAQLKADRAALVECLESVLPAAQWAVEGLDNSTRRNQALNRFEKARALLATLA